MTQNKNIAWYTLVLLLLLTNVFYASAQSTSKTSAQKEEEIKLNENAVKMIQFDFTAQPNNKIEKILEAPLEAEWKKFKEKVPFKRSFADTTTVKQIDGYVKKATLPNLKFICKARTIRIFNPSVNIFPTKNPAMMDTRYEIAASYKTIVFKSFFDIPILCKNTYSGIRFPRYDMSTVIISIIPQNNRIVPAERKLLLIPSSCIKYSDECPLENI